MLIKQDHHHIHHLFMMKKKLKGLYVHLISQAFAISMISIFIPIYLLQLDFSVQSVFIFLLIQWGSFMLFVPFSSYIVSKIGIKEVIILRTPLFIVALILLTLMDSNVFFRNNYFIIGILLGLSSSLYVLSVTSLFVKFMPKKQKTYETSKFMSLPSIGTIMGPFIGGLISITYGFTSLFIIVAIIMFLSVIPIAFLKHNVDHPSFSLKKFFLSFSRHTKYFFLLSLYGIKGFTFLIVWPIVIYLAGNSVLTLGIVVSGISLTGILFFLYLGKKVDKYGKKVFFRWGAVATTLLFILFGIYMNSPILIYISLLSGFAIGLTDIPVESTLFELAKKDKSPLPFLAFKEFSLFFGRIIMFIFLIIFSSNLEYGFYLGSLSSLLLVFF